MVVVVLRGGGVSSGCVGYTVLGLKVFCYVTILREVFVFIGSPHILEKLV